MKRDVFSPASGGGLGGVALKSVDFIFGKAKMRRSASRRRAQLEFEAEIDMLSSDDEESELVRSSSDEEPQATNGARFTSKLLFANFTCLPCIVDGCSCFRQRLL